MKIFAEGLIANADANGKSEFVHCNVNIGIYCVNLPQAIHTFCEAKTKSS